MADCIDNVRKLIEEIELLKDNNHTNPEKEVWKGKVLRPPWTNPISILFIVR